MYIFQFADGSQRRRNRSNRLRAKFKAKNRRRVNRMAGRRLSKRLHKKS